MIRFLWLPALLVSTALLSLFSQADEPTSKEPYCQSHREFITTLEYMRKQDHYKMGEAFSRDLAHQVSKGCTGAAKRFVKIYELLVKVEAGARSSAQFAVELSQKTDAHVDTFMGIFKNAYEPQKLDLDVLNSVKIAKRLSSDYKGDVKQALKDYERLVTFCLSDSHIGASAPQCAMLASELATAGENHQESISNSFEKLYTWLRTDSSTGISIAKAIEIAKNVVRTHPKAVDNFIAAYKYGLKEKGLSFSADQSLNFAMDITQRAIRSPADQNVIERLPASNKSKTQ